MSALNSRNSDLNYNSGRRASVLREPTYQNYLVRNRRSRRLHLRMMIDDEENSSDNSAVQSDGEAAGEALNNVAFRVSYDENLQPVATVASTSRAEAEAAAPVRADIDDNPEPSTSRQVRTNAIAAAAAEAEAAPERAQSGSADVEVIVAENAENPNPERHDNSADAVAPAPAPAPAEPSASQRSSNSDVVLVDTPSPPKKRKRTGGSGTPKTKSTPKLDSDTDVNSDDDDLDDGCTCPICFDTWEMSGDHRLVALRCGHLFGEACIRRWLSECARQSGVKMCPQCKTKATPRDIRYLYAKRVRAIDRTEEHDLRNSLEHERKKLKCVEIELDTLKITYAVTLRKVQEQDAEIERLKNSLRTRPSSSYPSEVQSIISTKVYKLFLEKNITLSHDSGCRVMAYSKGQSALLVSQKSSNNLFPGHGIRVIDVPTFRVNQFVQLTSKMLRDIYVSEHQQVMACTSMEPSAKIYDFRSRSTMQVTLPNSDKKLWACALGGPGRENILYAGGQQGSTYIFDRRHSSNVIAEYETIGDLSPVISIVVIQKCDDFPNGAFCICKLRSIWFYEYTGDNVNPTKLNVEGPFISMIYEEAQSMLIITVRINSPDPESRYLVGKLMKINLRPHFDMIATLIGSKSTPVMTRSCYVSIESNNLLASYIQDSKQLAVFDVRKKLRVQSLPIYDVIYDTCAIYSQQDVYVAALTENKCRIYKLNES